jgi:hypothetical protein
MSLVATDRPVPVPAPATARPDREPSRLSVLLEALAYAGASVDPTAALAAGASPASGTRRSVAAAGERSLARRSSPRPGVGGQAGQEDADAELELVLGGDAGQQGARSTVCWPWAWPCCGARPPSPGIGPRATRRSRRPPERAPARIPDLPFSVR